MSERAAGHEATRRDAVRRGIAAGGALLAAASVPLLARARSAFAQADGDAEILKAAIALEQTAAVAYGALVGSGVLDEDLAAVLRLLREQEQEHVDALAMALESLGGGAPEPPAPEDVDGLGALRSRADVLRFGIELERMAVAAYYDAHAKLQDAKLLQTSASIMAADAQHLVVLRQELGRDPSPDAFVTGEPA